MALDRKVLEVAVPAKYLERRIGRARRGLGRVELRLGRRVGEPQPRGPAPQAERRHLALPGAGEDHGESGDGPVRDELLGPRHDVVIPVAAGAALDAYGVRAG